MKKTLALVAVLTLAAAALALMGHHGHGRGAIAVSDHSRGTFGFEIHKVGNDIRGRVEFTEKNREHVFHVVRMPMARGADFQEHAVVFGGPGMLDNNRVKVEVRAHDGHADGRPDGFAIVCKNANDEVVYSARGEVRDGEIVIRHER